MRLYQKWFSKVCVEAVTHLFSRRLQLKRMMSHDSTTLCFTHTYTNKQENLALQPITDSEAVCNTPCQLSYLDTKSMIVCLIMFLIFLDCQALTHTLNKCSEGCSSPCNLL